MHTRKSLMINYYLITNKPYLLDFLGILCALVANGLLEKF